MNGVTPFDICVCSRCGPPWRNERPEPGPDAPFSARISWRSFMTLCPTCGSKRCPGAIDHDNHQAQE